MSQAQNAGTSSSKAKRPYRKGNPLSESERQSSSIAMRRKRLKEIKVFVEPEIKEILMKMCSSEGTTQADILQRLIRAEELRFKD